MKKTIVAVKDRNQFIHLFEFDNEINAVAFANKAEFDGAEILIGHEIPLIKDKNEKRNIRKRRRLRNDKCNDNKKAKRRNKKTKN